MKYFLNFNMNFAFTACNEHRRQLAVSHSDRPVLACPRQVVGHHQRGDLLARVRHLLLQSGSAIRSVRWGRITLVLQLLLLQSTAQADRPLHLQGAQSVLVLLGRSYIAGTGGLRHLRRDWRLKKRTKRGEKEINSVYKNRIRLVGKYFAVLASWKTECCLPNWLHLCGFFELKSVNCFPLTFTILMIIQANKLIWDYIFEFMYVAA